MTLLFNWHRSLVILFVALLVPMGSAVTADETARRKDDLSRKALTVDSDSHPKLKKSKRSKASSSLLASASKPRRTVNDEYPSSLSEADSQLNELKVHDEKDAPDKESYSRGDGKLTIGATARVLESQSELFFQARVDTGAASCSVHCEKWKIDDESDSMEENIGKAIRVLIGNEEQKSRWVDSRIEECVVVKTSEDREMRYKVPLTFRWNDFEKEVVVTLNNRGHMNFPLLLGRNFLEGDFVVDIEMGD